MLHVTQILNGKRVLLRHYEEYTQKRYHQKDLLARIKFPFHYSFNVFKFCVKAF